MRAMDILAEFTSHFHIQPNGSPRDLLRGVVTAFACLPYENITKIIKHAEAGSPEKSRRYPGEVITNHIDWGSGGTCFSLTSALLHLVRSLGWKAEYILADRRYGLDTHCALLVWIDDVPHLLDPGFLIVDPIPVSSAEQGVETGFNRLILAPEGRDDRISLSTVRQGSKTYRLTYKVSPVDTSEFYQAWDASFDWDMMHYPLLTRTAASGQIYLNGSRLQVSGTDSVERREITGENLAATISEEFSIRPEIVARAISILKCGG
jgi:arylamine N-acetyltransferase